MDTILTNRNGLRLCRVWPGLGLMGLLSVWSGCSGFPHIGSSVHHPTPAQVQTAIYGEDHYIYFPGYEIYYNRTEGSYVYLTAQGWVERFEPPPEVDLQEMLASPHVKATLPGNPAGHHDQMSREYPRNWGL